MKTLKAPKCVETEVARIESNPVPCARDLKGILFVDRKEYYGQVTFRPACVESELFAKLLGQKILTPENIETIKELGYEIRTKGEVL